MISSSRALLLFLTVACGLSPAARADLATCRSEAQRAVDECDRRFHMISEQADKADSENLENVSGNNEMYGGGAALMNAANANSEMWSTLPNYCRPRRDTCAAACNTVTGPERSAAQSIKLDCFARIQKKLTIAERNVAANSQTANQSAEAGNQAGSSDAESLQGSDREVAGCAEGEACGQRHPDYVEAESTLNAARRLGAELGPGRMDGGGIIIYPDGTQLGVGAGSWDKPAQIIPGRRK